jgi:ribosome-binding protein aMBF1 (putative translation factor)
MAEKQQISPAQIRAARALLDWSPDDLAARVGISALTLADFETVRRPQDDRVVARIRRTLEAGGVAFIDDERGGPGVRLRENRSAGDQTATIPLEGLNAENDE